MDPELQPQAPEQLGQPENTYYDIFGGESDLSDQSDSDAEEAAPAPKRRVYTPEPDEDEEDADDDDDDDAGGDGDYKAEAGDKGKKLAALKFKKRAPVEGGDGEPVKKKAKKVLKARAAPEEDEEDELIDPETARRNNMIAKIDAIIKKPKAKTAGKKRGDQEDILDTMNDEAVARLCQQMFLAVSQDIEENEAGRFAVNKLRMLPLVIEMMQKNSLAESLVDGGVLDAVTKWLEPLPDGSLPAVNIQRPLFENLRNLSIETSALKSSKLGKIVYFYTKCKRVEPNIARMANQLVIDWMRPIIRVSKAIADRDIIPMIDYAPRRASASGVPKKETGPGGMATNESIARRHARIPEALTATFTVAPPEHASQRNTEAHGQVHGPTGVTSKMKEYKKKLVAGQQASRRV